MKNIILLILISTSLYSQGSIEDYFDVTPFLEQRFNESIDRYGHPTKILLLENISIHNADGKSRNGYAFIYSDPNDSNYLDDGETGVYVNTLQTTHVNGVKTTQEVLSRYCGICSNFKSVLSKRGVELTWNKGDATFEQIYTVTLSQLGVFDYFNLKQLLDANNYEYTYTEKEVQVSTFNAYPVNDFSQDFESSFNDNTTLSTSDFTTSAIDLNQILGFIRLTTSVLDDSARPEDYEQLGRLIGNTLKSIINPNKSVDAFSQSNFGQQSVIGLIGVLAPLVDNLVSTINNNPESKTAIVGDELLDLFVKMNKKALKGEITDEQIDLIMSKVN